MDIVINNKKVVTFYQEHPHFDIQEMNVFLVDFLRNLMTQLPDQTLDTNSITNLLQNINKKCNNLESSVKHVEKQFDNIQKNIVDSISLQILSSKDQCLKDFENLISSKNSEEHEKHQQLANQNLDKLLDKLRLYFTDNFVEAFDKEFKQFSKEIHDEFSNATNSGSSVKLFENSVNTKYETLYNFILQNNHEFRQQLTQMDYRDDISNIKTYFGKQKNSSNKGADGENKLEQILNQIFPCAQIENTTGKSKSGDFIVTRNEQATIMFENKDYSNNVPVVEVDKFIRDIENLNCHGVFLSQNSGICKKEDFHIDIHNNNVMVFLLNVKYNSDKINLAVSMLDHLFSKLEQLHIKGDCVSEETLSAINKEFTTFIQQKTVLFDMLRKFNKDIVKQISDIDFPELSLLLSSKFANNDTSPLHVGLR